MIAPAVALLPWGNVWEDFLDTIGVSLDEFCTEMSGGWLFGYVEALDLFGVRTVLVLWSCEVQRPQRRVHVPTGVTVWVLPATRIHRGARQLAKTLSASGRRAHHLQRAASIVKACTATPPRALAQVLRQE